MTSLVGVMALMITVLSCMAGTLFRSMLREESRSTAYSLALGCASGLMLYLLDKGSTLFGLIIMAFLFGYGFSDLTENTHYVVRQWIRQHN